MAGEIKGGGIARWSEGRHGDGGVGVAAGDSGDLVPRWGSPHSLLPHTPSPKPSPPHTST